MISIHRDHEIQQSSSSPFLISASLEVNKEKSILRKRKCSSGTKNYKEYPDSDNEEFDNLYDSLKTISEKGMGKGVKTTIQLQKNTLLGEYTGKRLTYTKAYEKMKHKSIHYIVRTDLRSRYIDGEGKEGNILKYINHKCIDSNCELIKLTRGRVGISTKRDICADEVLNYNYKLAYFQNVPKTVVKCLCCDDCPNSL
jgi:SET domain